MLCTIFESGPSDDLCFHLHIGKPVQKVMGKTSVLHTDIVIIHPNMFRIFRGGKPQLCQTFAENADNFPEFQAQKTFLRCSKSETGFLALPALRPRAPVVLGVHRCPFAQQELCSLDTAVEGRPVQRRVASGGFPRGRRPLWLRRTAKVPRPRGRRKLNKAELRPNRPTNDECFWTQHLQNCSKQKTNHKDIEQVSMHLSYNITVDEMISENLFFKH